MKISGKLPLASAADTVLPSATARRGRCGNEGWGGGGGLKVYRDVEGGLKECEGGREGCARAREQARNFTRISETNFSNALRSRQAGVVNFWR